VYPVHADARARVLVLSLILALLLPPAAPAADRLPSVLSTVVPALLPFPQAANAGEIQSRPGFVSATVMPNGQVGLIYGNGDDGVNTMAEIRFKRYFTEHGLDPSQQLSTAGPYYPQIATFQGEVIAGYVDSRSPNAGTFIFRISTDNGATWGAEFRPFGSELFDRTNFAPMLVTSRDGTHLYLFTAPSSGALPQYRSTTDPTLATWTAAADAGDTTMHVVRSSDCSVPGVLAPNECQRSRNFFFTELSSGQWLYIAIEDCACTNGSRGTQVGTLGGSWSPQVDHGGAGGINSGAEGTATAFVDRAGAVYFLRDDNFGRNFWLQKSTDGGFTWGPRIYAYSNNLPIDALGSPFGLYVPGYSLGEYVWYAGFGGIGVGNDQNTARVIPIWGRTLPYEDTGTTRLFGSLGGDWDFGTAYPYTFGRRDIPTGVGAYKTSAEDLAIPGRLLNFSFSRSYNSADTDASTLGPAWSHSFNWTLTENGGLVEVRRGDGRRDTFARNPDLTYASPPNVYDVLTKNGDSTFTLTLKNQTQYEFSTAGQLTRIHEPAGNQITLAYLGGHLATVTDSVGRSVTFRYQGGTDVARGMTYTESTAPDSGFPDTSGSELTDALIARASAPGDAGWQGHLNLGATPLDVTVDLGSSQALGLVRSHHYDDPAQAIYKPTSVEVLTSPDNITFTSRGIVTASAAINDSFNRWQYDLDLGGLSARWVRLHITSGGTWLFSTEFQVFQPGFGPTAVQAGTNTAAGRTYTKSLEPNSNPDTGGVEFTDGALGNASSPGDASWMDYSGLGSTPVDVTVDLGSAQALGVARSYHGDFLSTSIFGNTLYSKPDKVEILTSTDNITFISRGSTTPGAAVNDSGGRWRYDVDLGGLTARWVRFRITASSIPGSHLLVSEGQVFGEGAAPVELPIAYGGDRLASIQDPIGRRVSYGYDQIGRLTSVVDKVGNAAGQNPLLHKWHYGYGDASAHITAVIDPDGRARVTNTYNSDGRLVSQKDGMGNLSTFNYQPFQTTITDPRSHVTTQLFDPRWRLSEQDDVVGQSTFTLHYLYEDAFSNLTATIDRNGYRTDYTYDTRGNVITKTDPQVDPQTPRYLTQYAYDAKNNLTQITDARTFVTTNDYDPVTNVKIKTTQQTDTQVPPTNAITKWEYGDATNPGLPTRIISPRGNTGPSPNYTYSQTLVYWTTAELKQRTDADGNKTTFGYDGVSRQTTMVDPDGNVVGGDPAQHTWTTVYDENDRVKEVRDPLSHSTFTGYDGAGNRTSVTDRNSNVTNYAYDGAARLLNVKQKPDPIGQPTLVYTTSVVRDGNGNATQVTQANGVVTDYGYDALNRLTSFTTHPGVPANLTTSYILDGNGNATKRTTGDAVETNYAYDALSRLKTVSSTGLPVAIGYSYDELSHRTSMTDGTGTSTYAYDGLGRLTQAVQPNGTLGYGYDLDSNRTTLTYPTVGSVTYVFSPAGRLSSLTDWGSRQSIYTYTASGLAKTVAVPGGLTTTYGYDNAQRLTSLVNATASATVFSDTYTLDNEGNRTAIDEIASDGLASVKVNSDTGTAAQDHPAIALGADGASYLIWDDARDGNANIYFARRDPATGAWGMPNTKVNDDTGTRLQQNPAISLDSQSNAYAVWQDERNSAGKPDIYYAKRASGGSTWSANVRVNDDGNPQVVQRNPRIAGTADGSETAVWVDLRSNQNNIYSSTLAAGGATWAANKRVSDNTAAAKDLPDVIVGSDGTSYAVWQDSRNGNADIYFSTLTSGGAAWAANTKISDDPGSAAQTAPRIGIDGSGNLVAAWIDARTSPAHVRAARRPAGGAWSASVDVSPAPANVQSLALAVRPDGYAWAVWGDTRGSSQDIWGSRYDPNLGSWSAPLRLDDDPGTTAA